MNLKLIRSAALCAAFALSANAATLIHSYTFTANANDSTGTEHGTLTNGASVSGGVLNLDGSDDYVQFASGLIPGSGSFSVLLSARLLVAPTVGFYMETISQGSSGNAFYLGTTQGSGIIRAGDGWGATGVSYPNYGAWHTFAVVRDADATRTTLYIDGSVASFINSLIPNPGSDTATRLGRQYNGHSEYFNGQIDNVQIYTGALTAGEVESLGGGGSPVPEPLTMALTGAGLLVVGLRRRLRAKHHHNG